MNLCKKIAMFLCIALGLLHNTSNAMNKTNEYKEVCKKLDTLLQNQNYKELMAVLYHQIDAIGNPYVVTWVSEQADKGIIHCLYLQNRLEHKKCKNGIITKKSIESALNSILMSYILTKQATACCEKVSEEYKPKAVRTHQVLQQKYKYLWYDILEELARGKQVPSYKKIVKVVASQFDKNSDFVKKSVQKPAYVCEIDFSSSLKGCWGITFGSPNPLSKDNFDNAENLFDPIVGKASKQAIEELLSLKNWEEYFAVCDKIDDEKDEKDVSETVTLDEKNEELSVEKLKIKLSDLEDLENEYDSDGKEF